MMPCFKENVSVFVGSGGAEIVIVILRDIVMLLPLCRFILAFVLLSLNLMVLSSCAMFLCIWYPLGGRVSQWMHAGLDWLQMRHAGNAGWILRHISGVAFVVDYPELLPQQVLILWLRSPFPCNIAVLSAVLQESAGVKVTLKRSLAYIAVCELVSAAMGYPFVDQVKSVKQGRAMREVLESGSAYMINEKLFTHPHLVILFEGFRFGSAKQARVNRACLIASGYRLGIAHYGTGKDFLGLLM